jgi:ribosomal protein L31
MKKDIHPNYKETRVICACGNSFVTRSTKTPVERKLHFLSLTSLECIPVMLKIRVGSAKS